MQRSEIRTQIRELIAQTDSTNTQFSDTVINNRINRAYHDFSRKTFAFETKENITTVANQVSYVHGTDYTTEFYQLNHVRYIESSDELGWVLKPYPGGYANLPRIKQYGRPDFYVVRFAHTNTKTEIIPWKIIDTSNYTLEVSGYYHPAELTNDTDEPLMEEGFQYALVLYSSYSLLMAYGHSSSLKLAKLDRLRREYLEIINEAKEEFSVSNLDENPVTLDVYG